MPNHGICYSRHYNRGGSTFVHSHNNLMSLKDVMDNFWNNINLLFQQRFDLISNLMTTVKEPLNEKRSAGKNN